MVDNASLKGIGVERSFGLGLAILIAGVFAS
jgi:hypothetical protein